MSLTRIILLTIALLGYCTLSAQDDIPGTQGAQETTWAWDKFNETKERTPFAKYKGKILVKEKINDNRYDSAARVVLDIDLRAFSTVTIDYDGACIMLHYINPDYLPLFEKGIISPLAIQGNRSGNIMKIPPPDSIANPKLYALIRPDSLSTLSPATKRFKCYVWRKGLANPSFYVFELKNDKADNKTDTRTFIIGATLTFFEFISILI
jgi:hypothetical protein